MAKAAAASLEPRCARMAEEMGFELVDFCLDREPTGTYLRLYIDRPEGISLDDFRRRFDVDLFTVYDPAILRRHKGLINLYDNQLYLTDAGMDVSKTVMAEFV